MVMGTVIVGGGLLGGRRVVVVGVSNLCAECGVGKHNVHRPSDFSVHCIRVCEFHEHIIPAG